MATRKKTTSGGGDGRGNQSSLKKEQERLTKALSERVEQLAENADTLAERAQHLAHQADGRVRRAVDRRPMTAVWTGFGLGVGLGLALVALAPERQRRGGWSLGNWSLDDLSSTLRDLSDRVESRGRSALHRAGEAAGDLGQKARRRARSASDYLPF